ncbi:Uncharacterized protein BP5553_01087 [Venustampulla echinocandica]|uniref:TeaA receptor TeaR n=1 Tax=Venustampulla echinocandica TaxID=2656787 RepID=A0A370U007_9HELO|nr:Uncharacterized protein BP5553_01087 [Venustampulla echinocandica]RDL41108.1 Uncharacterized protein BP5553_01087 [Venustampulla echinocandica]
MAAVSAPHAPNSFTPLASPNDGQDSWDYSVPGQIENPPHPTTNDPNKPPLSHTNGHANSLLAPARINALGRKDSSISDTGSAPDSLLDLYGPNRSGISSIDYGERKAGEPHDLDEDPDRSRWIHRDKLARIENEELQAAGIILPRVRAASKSSRREHSRDQHSNGFRSEQGDQKRQRTGTIASLEQEIPESNDWDFRLPEEVAQDFNGYRDVSGGVKGVSRIPVLKSSPLPIPVEHLERDTPLRRRLSSGLMVEDDAISNPKSRGRSHSVKAFDDVTEDVTATPTPAKRLASDSSPTKKAAPQKGSVASRAASAGQRPKTRSGPSRDASAGQRPPTRSGDLSQKRPEGDPPWLASMYKPDPRLPPDEQMLPTVAKRLKQEQWEKEGKFGNTYDTSFRPLNDEEFPQPEIITQTIVVEPKPEEKSTDWPLKSPTLSTGRPGTAGRTESYSTMPKLTEKPPQSPRPPPMKMQEPPEDATKKGGCGCCLVM